MRWAGICGVVIVALCRVAAGAAPWAEPSCAFRRAVTVAWNSDDASGRAMAMVDCLTGGHANPDGGDARVTTVDGREIPSRVLMAGPGDSVRVLFGLAAGVGQYEIYFGDPQAGPPQDLETMPITCGLLCEMRDYHGTPWPGSDEKFEPAWNTAGPLLGRTMAELPFIAGCPLGDRKGVIIRYRGTLMIPADSEYEFGSSTGNSGAMYIDGQPILYAPSLSRSPDQDRTITLSRGPHNFVYYQIYANDFELLSVDWRVPGEPQYKAITREFFGILSHGRTGDLESRDGKPTADFSADYQASSEFDNCQTHRFTFTAAGDDPDAKWDFGDGQTAEGATVDHVFLGDGVYAIQIQEHGDAQTSRLFVHADWSHQMDPSADLPWVQAKIVAGYDIQKIPAPMLPVAALMQVDAGNLLSADEMGAILAREKSHGPGGTAAALAALHKIADAQTDWHRAQRLWGLVPEDSDLQPQAAAEEAELGIWLGGDFTGVAQKLAPYAMRYPKNSLLQREFAHALILSQQADQGRKILEGLPTSVEPARVPAVCGALARTVEYYVENGTSDLAQAAWYQWDETDPASFLEGYSVLLRIQMMEQRHMPEMAASIAVAFAEAIPDSAYAPEMLAEASKALADSDPAKSRQILQMLKEKFPEDPLSQK